MNMNLMIRAQQIPESPIRLKDGVARLKRATSYFGATQDLGTKDGFNLGYQRSVDIVILFDVATETAVGYLELSRIEEPAPFYVNGVFVDPEYRGKKFGTVLYLGALHVHPHIASDGLIGMDAIRTWKSLEKFGYHVKMWSNTFDRPVDFKWGPDGIPVIGGRAMNKQQEEFVFYI